MADATLKLLREVVRALDDKKAGDLRVLRVGAQSSITDYLVLATGTSEPHLRALRVELEKVFDGAGVPIAGMESGEGSGWLVVDAYQVMVHVFLPEQRDLYRLERLWNDAEDLPLPHLVTPPKAEKSSRPSATKTVKRAVKKTAVKKAAAKKAVTKKSVGKKTAAKKTAAKKTPRPPRS